MTQENQENKQTKFNWQNGVKLFFQFSSWIVFPLIISLFLGKWLDTKFNTKPIWFFTCVGISFVITTIGLVINTIKYIKEIEKQVKK